MLVATRVFGRRWDEIRNRARQLSIGRLSVRLARHSPVRCDGQFGEPRQNGLGETAAEKRMDLVLIIIILVLLFGGGFGYRRWGYGGGIGIGGILLIVLIVYLLFGRGGL